MGAVVKVVAFPMRLGRRWAFQVLPVKRAKSSSDVSAGAGTFAMLRELMERVMVTPRLRDRIDMTVQFAEDRMHDKWTELEASASGTIRHRIYSLGRKLLARVEPSEQFFKSISKDAMRINIIHPTSVNSRLARRRVRHLAMSGISFHRTLLYGSIALVPFSALFAIIPFPNVVMAWNLFRAHAHWRALQGSKRLEVLVTEPVQDTANTAESKSSAMATKSLCSWECTPSAKLEKLVSLANASTEALSNEKIAAICKEYQLDTTDVTKWRDHNSKVMKLAWV